MRRNRPYQPMRAAALTLALAFFCGCGASTGPAPDVDTAAIQMAFEQVIDQYFNDNPGLDSLENTLEVFGTDITNALQRTTPINFDSKFDPPQSVGLASRPSQSMGDVSARDSTLPALTASVPAEDLGTTYEYIDNLYLPSDPPRAGAPENGVRFILYDDKTTLNEVGYVDFSGGTIFDAETPTVDVSFKGFITAISSMPVLDYHATGASSATGGALSFSGFLSDSSSQLDFDFQISGPNSNVRSATLALSAGDVTLAFQVTKETPPSQTLETSIAAGAGEIRFLVEVDTNGDIQSGSGVFLNDGSGEVLVARFAGSIGHTVQLTNADGNPLTQQELVALANIFSAIEYSFVLIEELCASGVDLAGVSSFF